MPRPIDDDKVRRAIREIRNARSRAEYISTDPRNLFNADARHQFEMAVFELLDAEALIEEACYE